MSKTALISVYDKTNIVDFAKNLILRDYRIISTGGTYNTLVSAGLTVFKIDATTHFPEILDGRVKTLHPNIFGGILAKRGNASHVEQLSSLNINFIDLVAVNLYPFEKTIRETKNEDVVLENIDIGGHSLIRAAAKNFKDVIVITDINDYVDIGTYESDVSLRKKLAIKAFQHIAQYDISIAHYFDANTQYRRYEKVLHLKYGCNPHQSANLWLNGCNNPYTILNGSPGYINFLDAINAWALVSEVAISLDTICAASFKHVSPAGVAIYKPFDENLKIYTNNLTSPVAITYLRARDIDPKSSFGDFIALSHVVDVQTATLIKKFVSDGIIAPDYEPEALDILKSKKGGKYIILKGIKLVEDTRDNLQEDFRDIGGVMLSQQKNYQKTTNDLITNSIVTQNRELSDFVLEDLVLANITVKYTQSNSVVYCYQGQTIGIGAGQQSRIDCVKLAGNKSKTWYMKRFVNLPFKPHVKIQDKINAIIAYVDGERVSSELLIGSFLYNPFLHDPLTNVSMASDAFFPFTDNIDTAYKYGVKYIIQPGGSIADKSIIEACDRYQMVMSQTGIRMFHH